jgi:hypothetical protein
MRSTGYRRFAERAADLQLKSPQAQPGKPESDDRVQPPNDLPRVAREVAWVEDRVEVEIGRSLVGGEQLA